MACLLKSIPCPILMVSTISHSYPCSTIPQTRTHLLSLRWIMDWCPIEPTLLITVLYYCDFYWVVSMTCSIFWERGKVSQRGRGIDFREGGGNRTPITMVKNKTFNHYANPWLSNHILKRKILLAYAFWCVDRSFILLLHALQLNQNFIYKLSLFQLEHVPPFPKGNEIWFSLAPPLPSEYSI